MGSKWFSQAEIARLHALLRDAASQGAAGRRTLPPVLPRPDDVTLGTPTTPLGQRTEALHCLADAADVIARLHKENRVGTDMLLVGDVCDDDMTPCFLPHPVPSFSNIIPPSLPPYIIASYL